MSSIISGTNGERFTSTTSLIYLTSLPDEVFDQKVKPYCYLLEIDNTKLLLDCGSVVTPQAYGLFASALKDISAILCTHASMEFVGGLPLIVSLLPPTVSIYMTLAAQCMMRILFADIQSCIKLDAELEDPIKESHTQPYLQSAIDDVFRRVIALRFSQSFQIENIIISPFASGASLGGAYWRIKKGTDDIIYAVGISTKKERHLDACSLVSLSKGRPSLFITDSDPALTILPSRKTRDSELIEIVSMHLKSTSNGDVLIVCPVVGKTLELVLLLDFFFQSTKPSFAQLLVLGIEASRLIDFAQSMLEWMGDSVIKAFGTTRENPFAFKHAQCRKSLDPKNSSDRTRRIILLATIDEHLQFPFSFARQFMFQQFFEDSRNLVVFTNNSPPNDSLSYELMMNNGILSSERVSQLKLIQKTLLTDEEVSKISKNPSEKPIIFIDTNDDEDDEIESDDEDQSNGVKSEKLPTPHGYLEKNLKYLEKPSAQKTSFTISGVIFPFKEKKKPMSPYGELLDPLEWPGFSFNSGKAVEENISTENYSLQSHLLSVVSSTLSDQLSVLGIITSDPLSSIGKEGSGIIIDPFIRLNDISLKKIACSFKWMDYFIRSDGRALKSLLSQLLPKKIILIHGGSDESLYLSQWYKLVNYELSSPEERSSKDISSYAMAITSGKKYNISVLANIFNITLSESLISSISFQSIENIEIARVIGKIRFSSEDNLSTSILLDKSSNIQNESDNQGMDIILKLNECESKIQPFKLDSGYIYIIGNTALSSLKSQIQSAIPSLKCILDDESSTIFIKRHETDVAQICKNNRGEFNILGDISPDFLQLKKLVSDQILKL